MRRIMAGLVAGSCLAGPVLAQTGPENPDLDCTVPMAAWQPREALRTKLENEGWTILRITIDDGCYEVDAVDPTGADVEAEFDPQTFQLLELEYEG
jgi:hypothetical protein